jgi:hypothetical protein
MGGMVIPPEEKAGSHQLPANTLMGAMRLMGKAGPVLPAIVIWNSF